MRLVVCGLAALMMVTAVSLASAGRAEAAGRKVVCLTKWGKHRKGVYRSRPEHCALHERGTHANILRLKDLRWKSWGPRAAVGHGRLVLPGAVKQLSLRVVFSQPRRACGHTVFTRARVSGRVKFKGKQHRFDHGFGLDRCRP